MFQSPPRYFTERKFADEALLGIGTELTIWRDEEWEIRIQEGSDASGASVRRPSAETGSGASPMICR